MKGNTAAKDGVLDCESPFWKKLLIPSETIIVAPL